MLPSSIARRTFLTRASTGIGSIALGSMLGPSLARAASAATAGKAPPQVTKWNGTLYPLHHYPRAKRVIWLYMAGGMSHLESFDYKPKLAAMNGQPMPESLTKGQQIAQLQGSALRCFAPQHPFKKYGKSGQSISDIFRHVGENIADEMCIVRSIHTDAINHDPAHTFMNTGSMISGRPSMGSWLTYGLGADTQNLPGFVVMVSTGKYGQKQPIAARQWQAGFLPSRFQGVEFRSTGDPVLYVGNPRGVSAGRQEDVIRAVQSLNAQENEAIDDPEIATRISQYEMAFRMQASVPDLMDVSKEPAHITEMYGCKPGDGSFASNCLLARRLAERGVRFIQLYHRDWDHHGGVKNGTAGSAAEVDQGAAALVMDLRQRGMLDDTLVVFGSEFGRTPMAQGDGRDHHLAGFTMWFAGGGMKPGISYGNTDDLGYRATENPVSVHDVHATLLHCLGIDHNRFTYKFQGLDFKLTGVEGADVVGDILV